MDRGQKPEVRGRRSEGGGSGNGPLLLPGLIRRDWARPTVIGGNSLSLTDCWCAVATVSSFTDCRRSSVVKSTNSPTGPISHRNMGLSRPAGPFATDEKQDRSYYGHIGGQV